MNENHANLDEEADEKTATETMRRSEKKTDAKDRERKEVKLNDEVMMSTTPESLVDESIDRILSCPSSVTKKYPSHLHKPKKLNNEHSQLSDRPFASLTQVKSGGSLINPNLVQVFYCLSSIIQAQIADDCERYEQGVHEQEPGYLLYPLFDISFPSLPPQCGGDIEDFELRIGDGLETLLNHELTDVELKSKLDSYRVPPLMTIFRYIVYLYSAAEYSPECNIMALVYINRLTAMNQSLLTYLNWRSTWLVVIMLAQKVWDDRPLRTSDFVRILPDIDSKILRELEYQTLTMLKYITGVKPSLYAKYYFELRQLYSDISGSNSFCGEWALEPLSNYLTSKFEMKNKKLEENRLKMLQQQSKASSSSTSSTSTSSASVSASTSSSAKDSKDIDYEMKSSEKKSNSPPPSRYHDRDMEEKYSQRTLDEEK